jgi:dienelactone hydrolase
VERGAKNQNRIRAKIMMRVFLLLCFCLIARAEIRREEAAVFIDAQSENLKVIGAARTNGLFNFTTSAQFIELDVAGRLTNLSAISVGGWFYPRRSGEQNFMARGLPEIDDWGRRFFRPKKDWINLVLGTDQRGFFMATANGNSSMPFPHVTVHELTINTWQQLVYVKDARGFQKFYANGALIHADTNSIYAGKVNPFREERAGEPLRLAMPLGGQIGEAWIFPRELIDSEIAADFASKRSKYKPAFPATRTLLREMNPNFSASLWKAPPTRENWTALRDEIRANALKILGPFPTEKPPLDPRVISEEKLESYTRRKISIQVQPNDRMPFWMLIPKNPKPRAPGIICWYGTSGGTGKDRTIGLVGNNPGSGPHPNSSFAIDMVEAGFVAVAPDWLRDGERVKPGQRPYDTTDFYKQFPEWSLHGKDSWDTMRLIDYLQTLDFLDPEKIGLVGHSYGGHSTIFTTAFEPRIKVAVANGPVSDFIQHGPHWGVPKGAGNSQSLPKMRPYVLDRTQPPPITFYAFTALIAPRPLLVGQAVGEHRPMEEENYASLMQVYRALNATEKVRYHWYAGDHDFPPEARAAAVEWFRKWLEWP